MTTTDTLCTACQHPAHWRGCQAIVRGPLGSDTRCACHRRGPQPDATEEPRPWRDGAVSDPITSDNAEGRGTFSEYRKTATTRISDFTVPPGVPYRTPEGLRAEDEETRVAFDVQGGVYPIRESVFRASYAPAEATSPAAWDDTDAYVDNIYGDQPEAVSPAEHDALPTVGPEAQAALDRIFQREAATPPLDWPDPKALATALYRDYDYTVTPDDIRAAYARLAHPEEEQRSSSDYSLDGPTSDDRDDDGPTKADEAVMDSLTHTHKPHETCDECQRGPAEAASPAALDVNVVEDILSDAESDGIIGPEYTPRRLAQYIVDSLTEQEERHG